MVSKFIRQVFGLMILGVLAGEPAGYAAASVRVLKIGVAVAPSYREVDGWKEKFTKRMAYASQIFEREFKIKLEIGTFWEWNPQTISQDSGYLLEDLIHYFPLHGVDIVIGLTKLSEMPQVDQMQDLEVLGRARPFSGYMVIRYPNSSLFKIQEETVLVHELGHLFGALHTNDPDSVMSPVVERQVPTGFDMVNREIMKQTRSVDFKTGLRSIDPNLGQKIIQSYGHLVQQSQPLEFYYYLGVMYLNLGQTESALSAWEKASSLDESNTQIVFDLGMLYFKLGHYNEAIQALSKAVSGCNAPWQEPLKAQALNALGETYLETENYLAAYRVLTRAAAIEPDNVDIKINQAVLQMRRGNARQAITELKALLLEEPQNARIHSKLGEAYQQNEQYSDAVASLHEALKLLLNPADRQKNSKVLYETYLVLGGLYQQMNDANSAARSFKAACDINNTIDCHYQMGRLFMKSGRWQDAATELSSVLQERKDDPDVYGSLGVALNQLGRTEQALGIFKEGLQYANDKTLSSKMHSNIGHLYLQLGRADYAILDFRTAVSEDWKNLEGHFGLAIASMRQNNFLGAQQELKTILQMDPNHADAKSLLADVQRVMAQAEAANPGTIRVRPRSS